MRARSAHGSAPSRSNDLKRGPQPLARLRPLLRSPQPLAVGELGPAPLERRRHELVQRECGIERPLERVVRSEEATATSCGGLGGDAAGRLRLTLEGLEDLDGAIGTSDAAVRLDQVGRPLHEPRLTELPFLDDSLHRLERHDRGFGIAAAELQQPERRAGQHAREQEAGRGVGGEARLRPAAALLVPAERGLHASDRRLSEPELGALGRLFEQRDRLVGSCEGRHPAADPEVELGQLDQRLRQVQQRAARPLHAHGPGEQSAGDGVLLHPDERPPDARRPSGARSPRPSGPPARARRAGQGR